MSALKSLSLAIELATRRRDQAMQVLMQLRQEEARAQGQLDQLLGYADETTSKWAVGARPETSPELLTHHYQFMSRLQHAAGLQQGVIEDARRRVEAAQKSLLETEFRLAGLQQVLKKKQAELALQQARREQRDMDEMAALLHGRARARAHTGETL
jgi:flagellar FliJ protein